MFLINKDEVLTEDKIVKIINAFETGEKANLIK